MEEKGIEILDSSAIADVRVGEPYVYDERNASFLLEVLDESGGRIAGRLLWGKRDPETESISWRRLSPDEGRELPLEAYQQFLELLKVDPEIYTEEIGQGYRLDPVIIRIQEEPLVKAIRGGRRKVK